jgi:SNF family Na+-dependent transporter
MIYMQDYLVVKCRFKVNTLHESGRLYFTHTCSSFAGPGLIFVAYPAALARLPAGPVFSVLFFLMMFTVGLDSQVGLFENDLFAKNPQKVTNNMKQGRGKGIIGPV